MKYNISIEIGREYIDSLIRDETGRAEITKVAIQSHDLMESLQNGIQEGASRWGFAKTEDLLRLSQVVKLSIPTIIENALGKRNGHKLGLMVTHPFEKNIYFPKQSRNPILGFLVSEEMVVGINEEVNDGGDQVLAPSSHEVRDQVRYLMESGASAIVISLKNAWVNRINETVIKNIVESEYPGHYLGAIPVFNSTDFSCEANDFIRTNICLLNVYPWVEITDGLRKIETYLRDHQFRGRVLVAQAHGLLTRTTNVNPLRTFASDKATSTAAALVMKEKCGSPPILNLELGENVTRANLINQSHVFEHGSVDVAGIPITFPRLNCESWGIGSSTRVGLDKNGIKLLTDRFATDSARLTGIRKPTIRDAYITLGYFAYHRLTQEREEVTQEKATEAITGEVAQPLGISAEEAAWQMLKAYEKRIGEGLLRFLGEKGVDSSQLVLLPSGIMPGIHACEIADGIKATTVLYSPFNAVLGAFGLDRMVMGYSYTSYIYRWIPRDIKPEDVEWLNVKVKELKSLIDRDMKHEGVLSHRINLSLYLQVEADGKNGEFQCPKLFLENKEDIDSLFEAMSASMEEDKRLAGMKVNLALLKASLSAESDCPEMKDNPGKDPVGEKEVYWGKGFRKVPIYRYEALKKGESINGAALVTSRYDTLMIPEGKILIVDRWAARIIPKI